MEERTKEQTPEAAAPAGDMAADLAGRRLKKALFRSLAAFAAALLLLGVTRLSIVSLLRGPAEVNDLHNTEQGAFVKVGVSAILGFYDENQISGDEGVYAVLPMQGRFVTLRLTPRYLESARAIKDQSLDFLNGLSLDLDKYFLAEGTVKTLPENLTDQLYRWFDGQKPWMQEIGLLGEIDDSADYLSNVMLEVDSVNGIYEGLVIAFSALAATLLIYVFAELVLMGSGHYLKPPKKKTAAAEISQEDTVSEKVSQVGLTGEEITAEPESAGREDAPPDDALREEEELKEISFEDKPGDETAPSDIIAEEKTEEDQ